MIRWTILLALPLLLTACSNGDDAPERMTEAPANLQDNDKDNLCGGVLRKEIGE